MDDITRLADNFYRAVCYMSEKNLIREKELNEAQRQLVALGKKFSEIHEEEFVAQKKRVHTVLDGGMRRTHADPV